MRKSIFKFLALSWVADLFLLIIYKFRLGGGREPVEALLAPILMALSAFLISPVLVFARIINVTSSGNCEATRYRFFDLHSSSGEIGFYVFVFLFSSLLFAFYGFIYEKERFIFLDFIYEKERHKKYLLPGLGVFHLVCFGYIFLSAIGGMSC